MKTFFARHSTIHNIITITAAILSGWLLASINNSSYPEAGSDYRYYLPHITDTYLHYAVNGLTIQWYTPSFGGGLPAYPNPQQLQFSITLLFTLFTDPWTAVLTSIFTYGVLGFVGIYLVCRRIMALPWSASLLAACLYTINGFYIQHNGIGHANIFPFPLGPLLLFFMLNPSKGWIWNSAAIGITAAAIVYAAGFYPIFFILLSLLACLPFVYLVTQAGFSLTELFKRISFGSLIALGLSASKLYAIYSYMRFFPREVETSPLVSVSVGLRGLFYQLLGSMNISPVATWMGMKPRFIWDWLQAWTGSGAGVWELDTSLSPVLWIVLLVGGMIWAVDLLKKPSTILVSPKKWAALLLFLLAIELIVEFSLAGGVFYPALSKLPVLKSLHINTRFASAFIMPLALMAGLFFHKIAAKLPQKPGDFLTVSLVGLTIVSGLIYFTLPMDRLQNRFYYAKGMVDVYEKHKTTGTIFPVQRIIAELEHPRVFDEEASNLNIYEPLFGYTAAQFKPQLVDGSVWLEQDGYFNMTNPSSMVYPEVNDNILFERIPVNQRQQLEDFINRRQPDWNLPSAQIAANILSIITALALPVLFIWPNNKKARQ